MTKRIYLLIILCFSITFSILAQSVPQGMNYQAVAREHSGKVMADQDITLKVTLMSRNTKEIDIETYSEVHQVRTNKLGLFTVTIGQGEADFGIFSEVPWSSQDIWMELAIDTDGGSNFEVLSNTKLLTVPFAFHAATASEVVGEENSVESRSRVNKNWLTKGNANTDASIHKLGTLDDEHLIIVTKDIERMRVKKGGNVKIIKNLIVGQDVTADNFFGDGSALTGIDVNDADYDPNNEIELPVGGNTDQVLSTDGNGIYSWTDNTAGPEGPQGIQGTNGLPGINGTDGVDGLNGETGAQGIQGETGPQGVTGASGTNGTNGVDGIDGMNGETGAQGIQGETGLQGATGPSGINGTNGIDGTDGLNGETGAQGIQGETGSQGPIGPGTNNGTPTEIAFFNTDSETLNSDADLFWDNVNKRLAIGTTHFPGIARAKFSVNIGDELPSVDDGPNALRVESTNPAAAAPGSLGSGIVFASPYWANDPTPIRTAGIYGGKDKNGTSGNFGGSLRFWTQPYGNPTGQMEEAMRIDMVGRLGIGTDDPQELLDVAGNTRTQGIQVTTGATVGHVLTSDANGTGTWQASAAGSQGPQGPAGTDGTNGTNGEIGATGAQGPQGVQGIQGTQGTIPNGTQNGEMNYWNGTNWVSVTPGTTGQNLTFCDGVPTWGPCPLQIGDAHAGGIIFYLDASGQHGLVAALNDQDYNGDFTRRWGCPGTSIVGTSTAVGSGQANTTAIINGCSEDGTAAKICDDYSVTIDGILYDDWFLPSKEELSLMYYNLWLGGNIGLGGFEYLVYWSSTENNITDAWNIYFLNGQQYGTSKGQLSRRTRAVRAF